MTAPTTAPPRLTTYTTSGAQPLPRWVEPLVLLGPAGAWLGAFLVAPVAIILLLSLVPNLRPESLNRIGEIGIGLDNYAQILDPVYLNVLWRSLVLAFHGTTLCLLAGYPVAYWVALSLPERWRNIVLLAFVLPLWTSSLLRTYAWITILRPTGVLNTMLGMVGLPSLNILNTYPAVVIGIVYSYLPYMVLVLYASLEKLDQRLLEAAMDLGANATQTFWRVTVPQTLPGIAAGSLLVYILSLGDFINSDLLGGTSNLTIGRLIYSQFLGVARNWGLGSSLSVVLMLGVGVSIALLMKYGDRKAAQL